MAKLVGETDRTTDQTTKTKICIRRPAGVEWAGAFKTGTSRVYTSIGGYIGIGIKQVFVLFVFAGVMKQFLAMLHDVGIHCRYPQVQTWRKGQLMAWLLWACQDMLICCQTLEATGKELPPGEQEQLPKLWSKAANTNLKLLCETNTSKTSTVIQFRR